MQNVLVVSVFSLTIKYSRVLTVIRVRRAEALYDISLRLGSALQPLHIEATRSLSAAQDARLDVVFALLRKAASLTRRGAHMGRGSMSPLVVPSGGTAGLNAAPSSTRAGGPEGMGSTPQSERRAAAAVRELLEAVAMGGAVEAERRWGEGEGEEEPPLLVVVLLVVVLPHRVHLLLSIVQEPGCRREAPSLHVDLV